MSSTTVGRRRFGRALAGGAVFAFAARARAEESREKLEGPKLDQVLAEIAKARKPLKTLKASFTQERKLTLLATTVKSSGEMTFAAPERLRWELGPPDDVVYWIGPEGLSYRTKTSKATTAPSNGNVTRALADLRAIIAGDLAQLKERYVLTGSKSAVDVEISGTAKDGAASVRGFSITLDKGLVLPMRARLLEGKSDTIDLVFSNAVADAPVDPATMKP
jgi:outer membrane lipoprotein-sorting protein